MRTVWTFVKGRRRIYLFCDQSVLQFIITKNLIWIVVILVVSIIFVCNFIRYFNPSICFINRWNFYIKMQNISIYMWYYLILLLKCINLKNFQRNFLFFFSDEKEEIIIIIINFSFVWKLEIVITKSIKSLFHFKKIQKIKK